MAESTSRLSLEVDSRGARSEVDKLDSGLGKLEKTGSAVANQLAKLGGIIGAAFAFDKTIGTVQKFEDSMLRLRATSGASAKQMAELEEQARKLGATSKYSASQAADAQNFLAMAGLKTNEILQSTGGVMQFAAAAGIELAQSADIASNVMGGMSLAVSDLDRVMDTMVNTAQSSNTSITQLGDALSYAAPLAVTAGVGIEELSAAVGVLGDAGLQGSRAGTGVLGVLRQLSVETPKSTAALAKYGLTMADVDIKTHGLTEVSKRLRDANLDTADAIRIFGSEAAPAALIMAEAADRMGELTLANEAAAGKTKEVSDIMNQSLSAALAGVNSAIEEAMLKVGQSGLTGAMTTLATATGALISSFSGMLPAFAEANGMSETFVRGIQLAESAIKALGVAIGVGLVAKIPALITGLGGLSGALTAVSVAARAAGAALMGPVGIAIAAGAAAVAFFEFNRASKASESALADLGISIVDATAKFKEMTLAAQSAELERMGESVRKTASDYRNAGREISSVVNDQIVGAFGIWGKASEGAREDLEYLREQSQNAVQGMTADWDGAAIKIRENKEISEELRAKLLELIEAAQKQGDAASEAAIKQQQLNMAHSESRDRAHEAANEVAGLTAEQEIAQAAALASATAADEFTTKLNEQTKQLENSIKTVRQLADEYIVLNAIQGEDVNAIYAAVAANEKARAAADAHRKSLSSRGAATSAATKASKDLAKAQTDEAAAAQSLLDKYLPLEKASRDMAKEVGGLVKLHKDGTITAQQYTTAITNLNTAYNADALRQYNEAQKAIETENKRLLDHFEQIRDKVDPAGAALRKYSEDVYDLKLALDGGIISTEEFEWAINGLGVELEQNQRGMNEWSQVTQRAVDSVDSAFVDMWRNIGKGFGSFADSLKNAFKQMLAEMAHMAITKPIMVNLMGAMGFGGGGAGGMLGSLLGGGGGGGGFSLGGLAQMGSSIYSAFTGWGKAAMAGFQSGGLSGAFSGVAGHFTGMASSAWGAITGAFGGGAAASSAATAAGNVGFGIGQSLVSGAASGASYAGTGAAASGAGAGGLGSMAAAWPLAIVAGMWQSGKLFDKGIRADGKALWDQFKGDGALGKGFGLGVGIQGKINELADGLIGSIVGKKTAAIITGSPVTQAIAAKLGSALFGKWKVKDGGFGLAYDDDTFMGANYSYAKKSGGLIGKKKKKTSWSAMDEETRLGFSDLFDETSDAVGDVFGMLGMELEESWRKGLKVGLGQISTMGKTDEQINEAVEAWFKQAAESMSQHAQAGLGVSLDYTIDELSELAGTLTLVNESLKHINVTAFETSIAGAEFATELTLVMGGLEGLASALDTYYKAFTPQQEQQQQALDALRGTFKELNVETPRSRNEFKRLVESLDLTDESAREMFAGLMQLSGGMDGYYAQLEQLEDGFYKLFTPMQTQQQHAMQNMQAQFDQLGVKVPRSADAFRDLVDSILVIDDASEDLRRSLLQLAPAMSELYNAQSAVMASIDENFNSLRETIFLDQLDQQGKYDYAKAQADSLAALLPSLTSIDAINETQAEIARLTSVAYNLLDEDGKKQQGEEYIKFLDEVQAEARQRAQEAELVQTEKNAKVMQQAMENASAAMAEQFHKALISANNASADVVRMADGVTQQFTNNLAALALRTTGDINA